MSSAVITSGGVPITSEGAPVEVGTPSYNEIVAAAVLDMPLQDDAASTVVVNNAGTDGTLVGGDNTADLSTTGPTTWLPKALDFDGAADYVNIAAAAISYAAGEPFAVAAWVYRTGSGTQTLCGEIGSISSRVFYNDDGVDEGRLFVRFGQSQTFFTPTIPASDSWHFVGLKRDSSGNTYGQIDDEQDGPVTTTGLFEPDAIAARESTVYNDGPIAGFVVLGEAADLDELRLGPEPTYTSGATLAANGAYDVGTWDAQSNGTITYEWRVRNNGTVVDSGTGESGFATLQLGTNLFEVRASNLGGYGPGDKGDGWYELTTLLVVDEHINTEYAVKVFPITAASKHPGVTASHKVILQTTAIRPPLG